jgi:hypothetical protein
VERSLGCYETNDEAQATTGLVPVVAVRLEIEK